jgi:uncharacterized protein YbbC (DUF1343 family)
MTRIHTGLDRFRQEYWRRLKGQSLGLLANQASVDDTLVNAKEIFSCLLPGQLRFILGPQHGFWGEDQDNMIETEDCLDPELHIPVVSSYGSKAERLPHLLESVDLLIIDLQDVGTRVYTFLSTMLQCIRDAHRLRSYCAVPQGVAAEHAVEGVRTALDYAVSQHAAL